MGLTALCNVERWKSRVGGVGIDLVPDLAGQLQEAIAGEVRVELK